eukprot:3326285-Prymnesium_polylepis.1
MGSSPAPASCALPRVGSAHPRPGTGRGATGRQPGLSPPPEAGRSDRSAPAPVEWPARGQARERRLCAPGRETGAARSPPRAQSR